MNAVTIVNAEGIHGDCRSIAWAEIARLDAPVLARTRMRIVTAVTRDGGIHPLPLIFDPASGTVRDGMLDMLVRLVGFAVQMSVPLTDQLRRFHRPVPGVRVIPR